MVATVRGAAVAALAAAVLAACTSMDTGESVDGVWTLALADVRDSSGVISCPTSASTTLSLFGSTGQTFNGSYGGPALECTIVSSQATVQNLPATGTVTMSTINGSGVLSFVLDPTSMAFFGMFDGSMMSGTFFEQVSAGNSGQVRVTGTWTATRQ